jgi:hypothetical protein
LPSGFQYGLRLVFVRLFFATFLRFPQQFRAV